MSERDDRLPVPGVFIERHGQLYAALEPSEVEEEHARPDLFFYSAFWRLLIRRGDNWDDAGYVTSQTESGRGFLQRRVMTTIAAFDGTTIDEFSFRMTHEPVPRLTGRIATEEIDRSDPDVARLRKVCHEVANTVTNAQQSLQVLEAFSRGAEYVIEMKDGFDYSDYYIPVMPGQHAQDLIQRETSGGMQKFMGLLSRERAEQIWPELRAQRAEPVVDHPAAPVDDVSARSTVKNLFIALCLVAVAVAIGIGSVVIAEADDAPGAALIGALLMLGGIAVAVKVLRRAQ